MLAGLAGGLALYVAVRYGGPVLVVMMAVGAGGAATPRSSRFW
jgi:hypothetical protein